LGISTAACNRVHHPSGEFKNTRWRRLVAEGKKRFFGRRRRWLLCCDTE